MKTGVKLDMLFGMYLILQGTVAGRQQVVTDVEREHVMSGNLDQLVEEQRRIDEEKDAEVRGEGVRVWRVWRGQEGGKGGEVR